MSEDRRHQNKEKREKLPHVPEIIRKSPVKEDILHHWNKIPAIKENYEVSTFKLMTQGVRSEILDLFREGHEEFDPLLEKSIYRHAFSAKEIFSHVQKKLDANLTLQNIYFHLSKLEEADLITRIASIKKGRHSIHYFGRTARLFIQVDKPDDNNFLNDEKIGKILELLEKLNPNSSIKDHTKLFTELTETMKSSRGRIRNWMEKNEEMILDLNIDFRNLYEVLFLIDRFDSSAIEISSKIAKLLHYPLSDFNSG